MYKTIKLLSWFYLTGLLLVSISCSSFFHKPPAKQPLVIFPPPPDTTRIQYLTSFSNSLDIEKKRSSHFRYVVGDEPGKPIIKPYGIEVFNGKIYICDTMLPGLEILDLKNQTFAYFTPSGLGQLKKPLNCALDDDGNLYVADTGRNQVVVFDKDGEYLYAIGNGQALNPTDVLIFDNKIWICDLGGHQVKVFDKSGQTLLLAFPEPQKSNPQYLFSPTNISFYDNKIYVTDTGDARVKIFDESGNYIGSVGEFGKRPGQFVRPKGLAQDDHGFLYVVDAAFENVQIFNDKSQSLMFFGGSYKGPGYMWLPAGITIDYNSLEYFQKFVHPGFTLKYLIFVTNQYGRDKVNVYGFVETTGK